MSDATTLSDRGVKCLFTIASSRLLPVNPVVIHTTMNKIGLRLFFSLMTCTLTPSFSHAVTIKFDYYPGRESQTLKFDANESLRAGPLSVGQLTLQALEQLKSSRKISKYVASKSGLVSIDQFGNPLEVISDREMRAYGWCFHLNGLEPGLMPDQEFITNNTDQLRWFWAYAEYQNGEWLRMCVPADRIPENQD